MFKIPEYSLGNLENEEIWVKEEGARPSPAFCPNFFIFRLFSGNFDQIVRVCASLRGGAPCLEIPGSAPLSVVVIVYRIAKNVNCDSF